MKSLKEEAVPVDLQFASYHKTSFKENIQSQPRLENLLKLPLCFSLFNPLKLPSRENDRKSSANCKFRNHQIGTILGLNRPGFCRESEITVSSDEFVKIHNTCRLERHLVFSSLKSVFFQAFLLSSPTTSNETTVSYYRVYPY